MAKEKDIKIVQPTVKRRPARFRGPFSSEEYNDFQDSVLHDIIDLASAANTNYSRHVQFQNQAFADAEYLRRRVAALEESLAYREFIKGKQGYTVDKYVDFHNPKPIVIPTSLAADRIASYNSQFGELLLSANAIENKFYNFSLRTREIIIPSDFSADVTGIFDKTDGNGTQDYEHGGLVTEGAPEYSFNGINETVWSRSVSFPLESDIDQVEVQLTAVVPAGISPTNTMIKRKLDDGDQARHRIDSVRVALCVQINNPAKVIVLRLNHTDPGVDVRVKILPHVGCVGEG